jgi:hypothetical protein
MVATRGVGRPWQPRSIWAWAGLHGPRLWGVVAARVALSPACCVGAAAVVVGRHGWPPPPDPLLATGEAGGDRRSSFLTVRPVRRLAFMV